MESIGNSDLFINRHLGLSHVDERKMLSKLGFNDIDQFINQVIPEDIHLKDRSSEILPQGCSEIEALNELEEIAKKNTKMRSLIGLGYYDNHMPKVIQRHVLENPELLQNDPIGEGWLVILKPESTASIAHLMTSDAYKSKVMPN